MEGMTLQSAAGWSAVMREILAEKLIDPVMTIEAVEAARDVRIGLGQPVKGLAISVVLDAIARCLPSHAAVNVSAERSVWRYSSCRVDDAMEYTIHVDFDHHFPRGDANNLTDAVVIFLGQAKTMLPEINWSPVQNLLGLRDCPHSLPVSTLAALEELEAVL